MENLQGNNEKEVSKADLSKSSRKSEQWTFLMVKDTGETIYVPWIKSLVIASVIILLAALVSSGTFYFLYHIKAEENQRLLSRLGVSGHQAAALNSDQIEKTIPVPEPVKIEAEKPAPLKQEIPVKQAPTVNPHKNKKTKPVQAKADNEIKKPESEIKEDNPPEQNTKELPVILDEFKCSYKKGQRLLDVRFKIKNANPGSSSVKGHSIVVLKENKRNWKRWVILPDVSLTSGKPSGKEQGQTFSISYFKNVHFKVKNERNPKRFKTATVFIFNNEGELLIERDYAVEIE